MKKSIIKKLFMGISIYGLIFICLIWFVNTQFLEKYYINQKKQIILESSEAIDMIYKGDVKDIELELEKLESSTGSYIFILTDKGGIKYNSFFKLEVNDKPPRGLPIRPPRPEGNLRPAGVSKPRYTFTIGEEGELQTKYMTLRFFLNNGDVLVYLLPLAAISQSVDITNKFLLITGISITFLAIIFAYVFSKKFTKPILEMNTITQHMAKQDFSKKCKVYSDDELGELAVNINYMSQQLEGSIRELNEKNEKLIEDIEREKQIDEMRKEFISSVSHELKTPITLIQGYAEGLKSNVNEDEESRNLYCDVIMDEAEKMDKLAKDLLNLSQLESGFFKLEPKNFNICTVIDKLIEKYKPIFEQKHITIELENEDNCIVRGDVIRIEQVLVNFINNAINHIGDERIIKLSVKTVENLIRISVYNTGKWIPEESIDKIWDSFYKVDKARTRSYGGTGLGLSIVQSILKLHKSDFGVVNVESGVEFWFELDMVG